MVQNTGVRLFVIALVLGFLGWKAYRGAAGDLELGIDLKGGSELIFKFEFKGQDSAQKQKLLTESIAIIQDRVDGYGLRDVNMQPIGDDRFAVQISAKEKANVDAIKDLITVLGELQFRITVEPSHPRFEKYWKRFQDALEKKVARDEAREFKNEELEEEDRSAFPYGLRWVPLSDRAKDRYPPNRRPPGGAPWVLLQLDDENIDGDALYNVTHRRDTDSLGGGWQVVFSIKQGRRGDMFNLTYFEKGTEKYMGIVLNSKLDSAPHLQSALRDNGRIVGGFSEDEARSLAAVLQAGALRDKPTLISERTVAADLAGAARNRGVQSVAFGFLVVLVLMGYFYMGPGLLANLALLLNLMLLLGVLNWFGAVLTLPGIAGVVLTVGMAVDSNILVFERIKEEKSKGRTVTQAVGTGYDRALVTIIDANITTLITAYFLFQIGSGPVRGFGVTLAIGIVASMFTALYVTRTFFGILMQRKVMDEGKMRGEFAPPTIRWMSYMPKAIRISVIAMVAGVVVYSVTPEKKKYDLDFTQGSKLIARFHKEMPIDDVRSRIAKSAQDNVLYRDVTVRVSAEGIGAAVASDRGTGFELRSQSISSRADIEGFAEKLRQIFASELLPGPFRSTIGPADKGGSAGTIYFTTDLITIDLVREALRQYQATTQRLPGATVAAVDATAGARAAFRLRFDDAPESASEIALNVRRAFAGYSHTSGIEYWSGRIDDDSLTQSQQTEAKATLAALEAVDPVPTAGEFVEADPFPLADRIDPSTAREHRNAAVRAIALSIFGIILYVAFRFRSWTFGFAAVVALVHDVVTVLGLVALANWTGLIDARLNLVTVAAFLTLIGYSINDTIVIFDRIRENRGTGKARFTETIDRSLNQTMARTIRTTTTTWIVVVIMLVMNYGASSPLEGFAFILTIGVLVGTYSSIFVASPTLLYLPWLWERCGSSGKTFVKRVTPFVIGAAVLLLGVDAARGQLAGDASVTVFNSLALSFPLGILAFFLLNFLRFVGRDSTESAEVPAT